MKLTTQEMLVLYNSLQAVANLPGAKFAYAVARNITTLNSKLRVLQNTPKASEAYLQFEKERIVLVEQHAKKNDGKPVIENGHYVVEDDAAFQSAYEELKAKHKDAVLEREAQLKEEQARMQEGVDIDLYTIPSTYLPQEITANQVKEIMPIIQEELKN